jgi:Mg2+/citrate symporter
LPSTPVFDWIKIQPVKMINLLLQNNINLSVLCWFGDCGKTAEVLMVERTENQFISLPARQVTGGLRQLMIKKMTFGDNC